MNKEINPNDLLKGCVSTIGAISMYLTILAFIAYAIAVFMGWVK